MKVSIIIPVYNVENYLKQCLGSCFAQTYSDIEVLAINDGSSDDSGRILDAYAVNEPRLRVFHQQNGGVAVARHVGVINAYGDWIMFVDSDDYITDDAVQKMLDVAINSGSDIASAGMFLLWPDGSSRITKQPDCILDQEGYFIALLRNEIIWGPCCKLFKRNLFKELPQIPSKFLIGEDLMMNLFVSTRVNNVISINKQVYFYRKLSSSTVFNVKYGVEYWNEYITYLINVLNLQEDSRGKYLDIFTHFRVLVSFNIIAGGGYITDKLWVQSILDNSRKLCNTCFKERITLILLRFSWLIPPFYWLYRIILLRKL